MNIKVFCLNGVRPRLIMRHPAELTLDIGVSEEHIVDFMVGIIDKYGEKEFMEMVKKAKLEAA